MFTLLSPSEQSVGEFFFTLRSFYERTVGDLLCTFQSSYEESVGESFFTLRSPYEQSVGVFHCFPVLNCNSSGGSSQWFLKISSQLSESFFAIGWVASYVFSSS